MTDIKGLMGDGYLEANTAQALTLEKLAEAALLPPIDLAPVVDISNLTNLRRVRVSSSHALLAYACDQGVLLRDRHTKYQYLLTQGPSEDMIQKENNE